jgi:hypothetical protein
MISLLVCLSPAHPRPPRRLYRQTVMNKRTANHKAEIWLALEACFGFFTARYRIKLQQSLNGSRVSSFRFMAQFPTRLGPRRRLSYVK